VVDHKELSGVFVGRAEEEIVRLTSVIISHFQKLIRSYTLL
jgi:hypothetical protein